jgi:ribonucleotide monophosphatase NagD (HAD superfamily)
LDTAIDRLHCSKEQCCVIGDRLDTEYFGVKQNILSFLVLTGVTKKEMLENSIIKPTKVFDDLSRLMLWDKEINRIV